MRAALALLLMLTPLTTTPARMPPTDELNRLYREAPLLHPIGAPCSTRTDIEEGTCNLTVKPKPTWR